MPDDQWRQTEPIAEIRREFREQYATKDEVGRLIAEAKVDLLKTLILFVGVAAAIVTAIIRLT